MTGLFNTAFPGFSWLDQLFGALPSLGGLVVWAAVSAAVSLGLYRAVSPQRRILDAKAATKSAQKALAGYDGPFEGAWPLIKQAVGLAFRQVRLTFTPALIASIPVVFVMAWLSSSYHLRNPESGTLVEVRTFPASTTVAWTSIAANHSGEAGAWRIRWPDPSEPARLIDSQGREILALPLTEPVPVVHKPKWWNLLFGNPAGYLAADGPIDSVQFSLPEHSFLSAGPNWMRSWHFPFFAGLMLFSIVIKVVFRIQ